MLVLILSLLLTANVGYGLECITDCSLSEFQFGDKFRIPDGQCQQRTSASECTVRVHLKYHNQLYDVEFGKPRSSSDFIYISPLPYLSYTINNYCSESTDCVLKDLQKKIDDLVKRAYNADRIYAQLGLLIKNPKYNHSIQCYKKNKEIVTCAPDGICGLSYDQQKQEVRARGCQLSPTPRVYVYDSQDYSALHVECTHNLCNDDATLNRIKNVLIDNGLIDRYGRRIALATKQFISFPLLTIALISLLFFYF